MIKRPVLISAISISLIFEIVIMILVYNRVGFERLPLQLVRLGFELLMIYFILNSRSRIAMFIFVGFHIFSAVSNLMFKSNPDTIHVMFGLFHLIIGITVYMHSWIEETLKFK